MEQLLKSKRTRTLKLFSWASLFFLIFIGYILSGAVTLNSSNPFSNTVRVAVHRYSRAAVKASSVPFTRQAL